MDERARPTGETGDVARVIELLREHGEAQQRFEAAIPATLAAMGEVLATCDLTAPDARAQVLRATLARASHA
jgi:hypothetical protein